MLFFCCIPFIFSMHLQVDNTWILYVAVYSWFLQSTLTGKLLENSNRVAIQFGAWVNSMKLTEAELYHSLGDGGMNGNSCICTIIWTHDTCSPIQANKGQSKEIKMSSLLSWRYNTGLASIYRSSCWKEGGGGYGVFYHKRGLHQLLLVFGIQNTPHTYLPTLIGKLQRKLLKKIEPSEVKQDEHLGGVKIHFTFRLKYIPKK